MSATRLRRPSAPRAQDGQPKAVPGDSASAPFECDVPRFRAHGRSSRKNSYPQQLDIRPEIEARSGSNRTPRGVVDPPLKQSERKRPRILVQLASRYASTRSRPQRAGYRLFQPQTRHGVSLSWSSGLIRTERGSISGSAESGDRLVPHIRDRGKSPARCRSPRLRASCARNQALDGMARISSQPERVESPRHRRLDAVHLRAHAAPAVVRPPPSSCDLALLGGQGESRSHSRSRTLLSRDLEDGLLPRSFDESPEFGASCNSGIRQVVEPYRHESASRMPSGDLGPDRNA